MGKKRMKGEGVYHDEVKKAVNLVLTPTGAEGLNAIAKSRNLSRSEVVERIARGLIPLADAMTQEEEEAVSKSS